MPNMSNADPVALFCSDIHLSHRAPLVRRAEGDWYGRMRALLQEINSVSKRLSVPVFIGGDIFHNWNPPHQVVCMAAEYMKDWYAIPGQHDLPYHNYNLRHKAAYGVLVSSGVLRDMDPEEGVCLNAPSQPYSIQVWGSPWGFKLPQTHAREDVKTVGLLHAYCWKDGHSFPGVPDTQHADAYAEMYADYDILFFGDNHSSFRRHPPRDREWPDIYNMGNCIRRNANETASEPSCYILYSDMSVRRRKFTHVSEDKFSTMETLKKDVEKAAEFADLIDMMKGSEKGFDFESLLHRIMTERDCRSDVRGMIQEVLSGDTDGTAPK